MKCQKNTLNTALKVQFCLCCHDNKFGLSYATDAIVFIFTTLVTMTAWLSKCYCGGRELILSEVCASVKEELQAQNKLC